MDSRGFRPLFALFSVALAGCSGTGLHGTTGGDTGDPATLHACASQSAVSLSEIPSVHRVLSAACAPTPPDANTAAFTYGASDRGAFACPALTTGGC